MIHSLTSFSLPFCVMSSSPAQSVRYPQGSDRFVVARLHCRDLAICPPYGEPHEPLDPLRVQHPTNYLREWLRSLLHSGLSFLW
jgi:hypothetical protein